jgi:methionine aminopeptidase
VTTDVPNLGALSIYLYSDIANKNGFQVVPNFIGHGIGRYFHGPPDILHFSKFLL